MKIFIALLGLMLCLPVVGQTKAAPTSYKSSYRGDITLPLVKDSDLILDTMVWSEWDTDLGYGVARFRLEATPEPTAHTGHPVDPMERVSYLDQMKNCSLSIRLKDSGFFSIGIVSIHLVKAVGDDGLIQELNGDGIIRMSALKYREFVQTGKWSMEWDCSRGGY